MMAKPNNNNQQNKPNQEFSWEKWVEKYGRPPNPMKYAKQMMRAYTRPGLNAINREKQTVTTDYQQYADQLGALWGAVSAGLPNIASTYNQASQGVMDSLGQALGGLTQYLGASSPAGELAAAGGYLGNMGASGLGVIASGMARNNAYGASTGTQALIDEATAKANALMELRQYLDDLNQQKLDLRSEARANLPQWAMQSQEYSLALLEHLLRQQALEQQGGWNDAANAYMASTFDTGPGGKGTDTTGQTTITQQWLSGKVDWNKLTPAQKATIRKDMRAKPGQALGYFKGSGLKGLDIKNMDIKELIQLINDLLSGQYETPGYSTQPGAQ